MTWLDENDILTAVTKWLLAEGWSVTHLSTARGQPKGAAYQRKVSADLVELTSTPLHDPGLPGLATGPMDRGEGPDVVATNAGVTWAIEAKARVGSQGVNRDYALSSVVASYGFRWYSLTPINRLGIAVPKTRDWERFRSEWLSPALREKLDLWVLWVTGQDGSLAVLPEPPG